MASNGVANDSILNKRKQSVLSALCKRLSLDPQKISTESSGANDIKDLLSKMTLGDGAPIRKDQEVMSWVAFADTFPVQPEACNESLQRLNDDLVQKSVLLGDGLTPSESDIIVFSAVHSFVSGLSTTERQKYPNVLRWMDYIQNKEDLGEMFEKITVEKIGFEPQKNMVEDNKATEGKKNAPEKEPVVKEVNKKVEDNKAAEVKKKGSEKGPAEKVEEDGKKKATEKEPVGKVKEVSVSLLNIQIGLILNAWKHPSADSLLVEEIDLGDGNICQVVSGLAKYYSPEELTNRKVVLITNVKPGKLRDVMSAGLVLCASNQDHTVVEPLLPPEGAKPGERVSFSGHDGKPEDVLNPKKKQLDKITPFLHTDDKGVATYDGVPFMTSAGPCTSSIPNGSIK